MTTENKKYKLELDDKGIVTLINLIQNIPMGKMTISDADNAYRHTQQIFKLIHHNSQEISDDIR